MEHDVYKPSVVRIVRKYSNEVASRTPTNLLERAMAAHETDLQAAELRPSIWRDWLRFEAPEP